MAMANVTITVKAKPGALSHLLINAATSHHYEVFCGMAKNKRQTFDGASPQLS
jgi:hypothetical protein